MKKLITLIIAVVFTLNSAGQGYVEGYALRPMAVVISGNRDGSVLFPDEGTIRERLQREALVFVSDSGMQVTVYGNDDWVVKVPRKAKMPLPDSKIRKMRKEGILHEALYRVARKILPEIIYDRLRHWYLDIVWPIIHGEFDILRKRLVPIFASYTLGLRLNPAQVIPYRIVRNLEIKVMTSAGVKTMIIPVAIVQERVENILLDELKSLSVQGDLETAKKRIDEALKIYEDIWRKGIFISDVAIAKNMGLREERVCLCDAGSLFEDRDNALERLEGMVHSCQKYARTYHRKDKLPQELCDYFAQRAAEVFTLRNLNRCWNNKEESGPAGANAKALSAGDTQQLLDSIFPPSETEEMSWVCNQKSYAYIATTHYIRVGDFIFVPPNIWESYKSRLLPHKDSLIITALALDEGDDILQFPFKSYTIMSIITLQAFADLIKGQTVLDAGCGYGVLSAVASRLGAKKVIGIDIKQRRVEQARASMEINGITNVEVFQADILGLKPHKALDGVGVVIAELTEDGLREISGGRYNNLHAILGNAASKARYYFALGLMTKPDKTDHIPIGIDWMIRNGWEPVYLGALGHKNDPLPTSAILRRKAGVPLASAGNDLDAIIDEELSIEGAAADFWGFMTSAFGHYRNDFQVALVNKCPFNCLNGCTHCLAVDWMEGERVDMDPAMATKEIIDALAGSNEAENENQPEIAAITFTGGEPTLWFNTAKKLFQGKFSKQFLDLVRYAKEKGVKVVISTSGAWIPTGVKAEVIEKFFRKLPDNVVIELSLDEEHQTALRNICNKELKDIIRIVEDIWVDKLKREVRYNIRVIEHSGISRKDKGELAIEQWDHNGKIWRRYLDEAYKPDNLKTVKLSRVKLQSRAAEGFEINKASKYSTPMAVINYVQNFLPNGSLPCISVDGSIVFDPHSLFHPTPPPISRIGKLGNGKSLAELILDGIIGRWVGFDKFPFLRYLYLACYFNYIGKSELADRCLAIVKEEGRGYEEQYLQVTGVSTFDSMVDELRHYTKKDRYIFHNNWRFRRCAYSELERHFFLGGAINLYCSDDTPSYLRGIISTDMNAVWDSGEGAGRLFKACIRDLVQRLSSLPGNGPEATLKDLFINRSVENIVKILEKGQITLSQILVVSNGDFALQAETFRALDEAKDEEFALTAFGWLINGMSDYFGSYSDEFLAALKSKLEESLAARGPKGDFVARMMRKYIENCGPGHVSNKDQPPVELKTEFIMLLLRKFNNGQQQASERDRKIDGSAGRKKKCVEYSDAPKLRAAFKPFVVPAGAVDLPVAGPGATIVHQRKIASAA